ncbi:mannosyl-3-phosphoglycerate phosphatase [Enterobacter cloacae]|uniref:Mannosyl-3-phosphoglycerate phosphatase n=1 Tax=Enterobacter cloacae TaxID=550 RepID=A0A377LZ20_ENTCL|nr:mannosyl-3-phosphoglycerate phosphatase [Enterobacter cloacae]
MKPPVTLIWRDTDEKMVQFEEELAQRGLKCLQGARFWHILDARCGKDVAVNWLVAQYREQEGIMPTTLGLGDGPNDAPLLDSVDFAVVIKGINRQGITLRDDNPARVYHTQQAGPAAGMKGWITSCRDRPRPPGCGRAVLPDTAGHPLSTAVVRSRNSPSPARS